MRVVLVVAGAAAMGYGAWLLAELFATGTVPVLNVLGWWLAGPVLVDLAVIPLVVLAGVLVHRFVPVLYRRPVAAGLAVSLLVTLVALPFLSGFGRRADNPSLLDRDYTAGYLWLLAAVWIGCGAVLLRRRRKGSARGPSGAGAAGGDPDEQ